MRSYYEFFAGGGMARAGLGQEWSCLFANDIDTKKAFSYATNWGNEHLKIGDIANLNCKDLPGIADLAWASFPCQDLSLAGNGAGLNGVRSGTFWSFWRLMQELGRDGRAPALIVLENVCGALTSHGGNDFAAIGAALFAAGYRFGAVIVDAVHFLPQSRPRLFMICVKEGHTIPRSITTSQPVPPWQPVHLANAYEKLSSKSKEAWVWWRIPAPPGRSAVLSDLLEDEPTGVAWHTENETRYLLSLMSSINRRKVEQAKKMGTRVVGAVYKRTRINDDGQRAQRAEVRFDDIAGCLRTPVGGSSRQQVIIVEGKTVRSRLLSPREAARLMGLPDTYELPQNYNQAYHISGDGVAVPVVRFLTSNILELLLAAGDVRAEAATSK